MGKIIPCAYALLPNKTQETYTRLLRGLTTRGVVLNPTTVMTDFELAAQNAFEEVFPNVQLTGCYFHLTQSVWRNVQVSVRYYVLRYISE